MDKPVLTIREQLMFHTKPYDSIGFVLKKRIFGNLLFYKTLQSMKEERKGGILWVKEFKDGNLKKKVLNYFKILLEIDEAKFARFVMLTHADKKGNLDLYIFGDGHPDSFGFVAYAVFNMQSGSKTSILLILKAKPGPMVHKERLIKMNSAVLSM